MPNRRDSLAETGLHLARRGDLWMIKALYLIYLLKKHGFDLEWLRTATYQDKQSIYQRLEALSQGDKMNVGDKVTWTHTTKQSKSISMTTRDGVIEEIKNLRGLKIAVVKRPNRRREEVPVSKLRPAGAKSELTEFVEQVAAEAREKG